MIWDELPAVTLPSSLKAGFSFASPSSEESGRIPSSAVIFSSVSLPSSSRTARVTSSRSKRPSSVARAARWWLRSPNASSSSREMPHWSAIISAPMPWPTSPPTGAYRAMTRGPNGKPSSRTIEEPMGVRVMPSTPIATTTL